MQMEEMWHRYREWMDVQQQQTGSPYFEERNRKDRDRRFNDYYGERRGRNNWEEKKRRRAF